MRRPAAGQGRRGRIQDATIARVNFGSSQPKAPFTTARYHPRPLWPQKSASIHDAFERWISILRYSWVLEEKWFVRSDRRFRYFLTDRSRSSPCRRSHADAMRNTYHRHQPMVLRSWF